MSGGIRSRRLPTETQSEQVTRPTLLARGPDREVIGACAKFIDLELHRQRTLGHAATVEAEAAIEVQIASTDEMHARMVTRVCDLRATTWDGFRAKAVALVTAEPLFLAGELEGSAVGGRVLASMLRDMLDAGAPDGSDPVPGS